MQPTDARCSLHPELPSVGACLRCGRFVCEGCRVPAVEPLCVECVGRLEGPQVVRFRRFGVGTALGSGLALLRQEWARVLLVNLPFAVAVGASATFIPELNPRDFAGSVWPFYGGILLQSLFTTIVCALGQMAGLALLVGAAEGRPVSLGEAFAKAERAWFRVVVANLRALLMTMVFSLACGIPGVWKAVNLALVSESAFFRRGDALEDSEGLVGAHFWPMLGFLFLTALMTTVPVSLAGGVVGAGLRLSHIDHRVGLAFAGFAGLLMRSLAVAFQLSAYYGLTASAQRPVPSLAAP